MCGICGIVSFHHSNGDEPNVRAMNSAMAHRGPNAEGIWHNQHVALGHRRLSIIDLSAAGNQPMVSNDQRYILVFNGEIYNFREIQQELSDYAFQTHSDSEVILAAYSKWGQECVNHFNGMFAFAIWDNHKNELYLVRDRLGIKPVYYYADQEKLIFASEIRSILSSGFVSKNIDQNSLVDYLRYQTVHAPNTIINGVKMLMPGQFLLVQNPTFQDRGNGRQDDAGFSPLKTVLSSRQQTINSGYYWEPGKGYSNPMIPQGKSKKEIQRDILELLTKAIERRLIADVPFGAFLSGGIDSSIIVGLMTNILNQPVNTFSVTFAEKEFSESPYSRLIAKRFNTRHTEIKLKSEDFLSMLPHALDSMDHPSGDGPNTWVVSKVTKEAGITMALSGLGGDELFAGYQNFKRLSYLHRFRKMTHLPTGVRNLPACLLDFAKPSTSIVKIIETLQLPGWDLIDTYPISRQILPDDKIRQLLISQELPSNMVESIVQGQHSFDAKSHFLSQISCAEIASYMQNILLRDTDQMSMAHALEVRVPFMDYQLVEYVLKVDDHIKYPKNPKQLLVESVGDLLPRNFSQRPKMGFVLPWDYWMHHELKLFCQNRIQWLSKQEYFNSRGLMDIWIRFLNNDPLITWSRIWTLVALANWLKGNDVN